MEPLRNYVAYGQMLGEDWMSALKRQALAANGKLVNLSQNPVARGVGRAAPYAAGALDYYSGLQQGEDPIRAGAGALGSTGGAVGGAALGASLGSFIPGPGNIAGAVVGGVLGGLTGGFAADRVDEAVRPERAVQIMRNQSRKLAQDAAIDPNPTSRGRKLQQAQDLSSQADLRTQDLASSAAYQSSDPATATAQSYYADSRNDPEGLVQLQIDALTNPNSAMTNTMFANQRRQNDELARVSNIDYLRDMAREGRQLRASQATNLLNQYMNSMDNWTGQVASIFR